jgi:hypothetical protein
MVDNRTSLPRINCRQQSVWSDRRRCADRGLGCEFRRTHSSEPQAERSRSCRKSYDFLGLDVHAETIAVAIAEPDGEVRSLGTIPNRADSLRRLIKKLCPTEKLRTLMRFPIPNPRSWSFTVATNRPTCAHSVVSGIALPELPQKGMNQLL